MDFEDRLDSSTAYESFTNHPSCDGLNPNTYVRLSEQHHLQLMTCEDKTVRN